MTATPTTTSTNSLATCTATTTTNNICTNLWLNDVVKAITANNWDNARAMQAIPYFLQDITDAWYQSLAIKPQNFNEFKTKFLSSILQHVRPMHPQTLQNTVTNVQDFEAAELEANHAQAINLVMNESSELDSKLKQFTDILNTNDVAIMLTFSLSASSSNLSTTVPTQLLATVLDKLSTPTTSNTATELISKQNSKTEINIAKLEIVNAQPSGSQPWNSSTEYAQNPNSQNYLSLLVTPEDTPPDNPETNQKQSLTNNILPAIITNNELLATIFLFKLEKTTPVPLFSGATFDTKPIITMYTNAKVNGHFIKLILDSGSAGSIITKQLMDQLGHQVDYTASTRIITTNRATKTPIGEIDNFPIEVNGIIVPIKDKLSTTWEWEENKIKEKGKEKKENSIPTPIHLTYTYTTPQLSYHHPKLICIDCGKKLLSMDVCYGDDEEYSTATKFYCHMYIIECFGCSKQKGKWNNELYLACGETLLDERMWNDIPGQEGMCNELCQYMILINNWVRKEMPIDTIWRQVVKCLDGCSHDDNKIWQITLVKIEGVTPKEIKTIKDNSPKSIELD
ncbi:hypothetical protein G9A89_023642 [Geosiphon pyriformis]|nr:hypothetical protein G9A89_023642 [Geosiphon pyriformis]